MTLASLRRPAPHLVRIGAIDPSSTLLESLVFPLQEDTAAMSWIRHGLAQAIAHRVGMSIIGDKGLGKSLALAATIARFEADEERRVKHDATYRRRHVVRVSVLQAERESDLIRQLAVKQWGRIPPALARAKDAALFEHLVRRWLQRNVVAVIFDEAEQLSDAGLKVVRDILAKSRDLAELTRVEQDAAGNERLVYLTAGIGVLMVGTHDFAARLRGHFEYGQRFWEPLEVAGVEPDSLGDVYARYLPCWGAQAAQMGPEGWGELMRLFVAPVIGGNLRRIEQHARQYVSHAISELPVPPTSVDQIPFDDTWFLDALNGLPPLPGTEPLR